MYPFSMLNITKEMHAWNIIVCMIEDSQNDTFKAPLSKALRLMIFSPHKCIGPHALEF